mmetsp:Transcript_70909/g.200133  ORF Transcript_70909/g.200133 Transcript_70909/m.200133 type:complete len:354 (-) Transcript_70909:98-1159(-)
MSTRLSTKIQEDRRCLELLLGCNPLTVTAALGLVFYFVVGAIFYCAVEDWGLGDALYFGVVVMTTVGYGDFLPSTDGSKVFTALYVLYALVIAVFALSHIMNTLHAFAREGMMKSAQADEDEVGLFTHLGKGFQRKVRRWKFLKALGIFAVSVLISTVVFGATMDWEGGGYDGNDYVNGFYFSIVSLTTVGFGDIAPPRTQPFHMFLTVILMLFGIPIFGNSLSAATEYFFGESEEEVTLKIVRNGMNMTKFSKMNEFAKELSEAGAGNAADDKITRFEFLAFVLVANGIVDMSLVTDAIKNFQELDKDGNGFLTAADLKERTQSLSLLRASAASGGGAHSNAQVAPQAQGTE